MNALERRLGALERTLGRSVRRSARRLARWLNSLHAIYGDGTEPIVKPGDLDPDALDAQWEAALERVYGKG